MRSFARQLQWPISFFGTMITELTQAVVDSEKALKLLETIPEIVDKPDAFELVVTNGEIEFGLFAAPVGVNNDGAD
jgi:ABC-type transport system involved in Fe-S cluster assembly fused permease/ATPase subunit